MSSPIGDSLIAIPTCPVCRRPLREIHEREVHANFFIHRWDDALQKWRRDHINHEATGSMGSYCPECNASLEHCLADNGDLIEVTEACQDEMPTQVQTLATRL